MDFFLWLDSLIYPRDTFRAEVEYASFRGAIKNVLAAGFVYGAITGFLYDIFPQARGLFFPELLRELLKEYSILSNIFLSPLLFLFLVFLASFVFLLAGRICGGYGNFKTQTYLLSSLAAPLILSGLLALIPGVGKILIGLLFIYALWPLYLALEESHKFKRNSGIFTLGLTGGMFLVLGILFTLFLLQIGFSVGSWGVIENSQEGFRYIEVGSGSYQRDGVLEFELKNRWKEEVIVADLTPLGDCFNGKGDLDKSTPKNESFMILEPNEITRVKISNCQGKFKLKNLIGSKFFVPLEFKYQEKHIGTGVMHQERGILEGMVE